jgi:hypothetical protein
VHTLGEPSSLRHEPDAVIAPAEPPPVPSREELAPAVPAQTYVWSAPVSWLTPAVWSYEDFVARNAWKWVGAAAAQNRDFMPVEERRAEVGGIVRAVGQSEVVVEET